MIQALSRIEGMMAFLLPIFTSLTIAQSKRESIIERPIIRTPFFISPLISRTAIREEQPVPQGKQSNLPGSITTVFRLTLIPSSSNIGSASSQNKI